MLYSVCHVKCLLQCVTYVYSCTKVIKVCLPTYLQNGDDCFLLACWNGHEVIVRELLTKDKVDQNVVDNVRNCPVLCLFVHCAIVCVPHLQDGRGALHLACEHGHAQLVKTLVEEFRMSPDTRDNVSILTVHELQPLICT